MKDNVRPQTERVGGDTAGKGPVARNNAGGGYGHQGQQHPRPEKVTEHQRGAKATR